MSGLNDLGDAGRFFSADYATARDRFRDAAGALGWTLETHPIGALGPGGEQLSIDVATSADTSEASQLAGFPLRPPSAALVVSSGLHGVEGFFGSAVQLAALQQWAKEGVPRGLHCVFLHALNSYGFAWLRRVNESNVDLNRNFLRDGDAYRGSPPGYASLDGLLNPRRPPSSWEPVRLKFLYAIARHGMPALKQSIATGQYDYPQGLFFGGHGASRTKAILSANFSRWVGDARRALHLDLHSGLGARARHKLLLDRPPADANRLRLERWFGKGALEVANAQGMAYAARGSIGPWSAELLPDCDYVYAAAEFGTASPTAVLAGLRAENQAHHWGAPEARGGARAKRRLVELFCPPSPKWRQSTLVAGVDLVMKAARGLPAA